MSASQVILENAQYHGNLLRHESELSDAPSALSQQMGYLVDLEECEKNSKDNFKRLVKIKKKRRKGYESYRDSTGKRLVAELIGNVQKFEMRKEKKERVYIEALENEMKERDTLSTIESMIFEGNRLKDELFQKCIRLTQVQDEIYALYDRIFDGPTQEFPRDDELESQLKSSQQEYDRIQEYMNTQSQAIPLLSQADTAISTSLEYIRQIPLFYSTSRGPSSISAFELSASISVSRAGELVEQARRACPEVKNVGRMRVYNISTSLPGLSADVYQYGYQYGYQHGGTLAAMEVAAQARANYLELQQAHEGIRRELKATIARREAREPDLIYASEVLSRRLRDLYQYRRDVFRSITTRGEGSQSPSTYEATFSQPTSGSSFRPTPPGYGDSRSLGTARRPSVLKRRSSSEFSRQSCVVC